MNNSCDFQKVFLPSDVYFMGFDNIHVEKTSTKSKFLSKFKSRSLNSLQNLETLYPLALEVLSSVSYSEFEQDPELDIRPPCVSIKDDSYDQAEGSRWLHLTISAPSSNVLTIILKSPIEEWAVDSDSVQVEPGEEMIRIICGDDSPFRVSLKARATESIKFKLVTAYFEHPGRLKTILNQELPEYLSAVFWIAINSYWEFPARK
jgi:hypothetical protein